MSTGTQVNLRWAETAFPVRALNAMRGSFPFEWYLLFQFSWFLLLTYQESWFIHINKNSQACNLEVPCLRGSVEISYLFKWFIESESP